MHRSREKYRNAEFLFKFVNETVHNFEKENEEVIIPDGYLMWGNLLEQGLQSSLPTRNSASYLQRKEKVLQMVG